MDRFVELAEVRRNGQIESIHFGVAAVANVKGEVIAGWGDTDTVTFPRSSMKPFQALPLIETGAADAFGLTPQHLALACGSHRGEAFHTDLVASWLEDIGCSTGDLACGPEYPKHQATQRAMIAKGAEPTALHHNCSGKHTGLLSVCRHCGYNVEGYADIDHPMQQHYARVLADLDATVAAWGTDGCILPTPAMSVGDAARIGAKFAAGLVTGKRWEAADRLLSAMRDHSEYTSGSNHVMGAVIAATNGRVVFKGGAEAFLLAFLPDDGLAVAIKVIDGNSRARVPALIAVLRSIGVLSDAEFKALIRYAEPNVTDSLNQVVGSIHAASVLASPTARAAAE